MRDSRSSAATRADTCVRSNESFHLGIAAKTLRCGGIVAHATEGVWGLACDPFDGDAAARLLDLKRRSIRKGLILIGADVSDFGDELSLLNDIDEARVLRSWPGPDTWLVPNVRFPTWISGGRSKVAVRVPGHSQSRRLCERFGGPLVSTSANPSGRPAARNELAVRRYFGGDIEYLLHGATAGAGSASRIRDAQTGVRYR